MDAGRLLEVVREDRPDLVALGHPDRRPRPLLVVAERLRGRHELVDVLVDLVDRELEDLDLAVELGLERREDVVQDELRDLGEGRLELELGVVVGGAQDVDELGERRVAVDPLERRGEVADVAPDDRPGVEVVLRPAGRQRHRPRRPRSPTAPPRPRPRTRPALAATLGAAEAEARGDRRAREPPGMSSRPGWSGCTPRCPAAMRPPPVSMAPRRKPLRVRGEVSGVWVGQGSPWGAEVSMRAS